MIRDSINYLEEKSKTGVAVHAMRKPRFRGAQPGIECELQQVPNAWVVLLGGRQHSLDFVFAEVINDIVGFCLLATDQFTDLDLVERVPVDDVIVQSLIENCAKGSEWGYEVTSADVVEVYDRALEAASRLNKVEDVTGKIHRLVERNESASTLFVLQALHDRLRAQHSTVNEV